MPEQEGYNSGGGYNFYDPSAPSYQDPYDLYGVYQAYGGQDQYNQYLQGGGNIPSYGYGEDFMAQLQELGLDTGLFNAHFGQMRKMDPFSGLLKGIGGSQGQVTMETLQKMYEMGLDPSNPGLTNLFQSMLGIDPNAEAVPGAQPGYESVLPNLKGGGYGMSKKALKMMAKDIIETMKNPGMDKEVMADARGAISAAAKGRERSLLERHAEAQAGRGMFRSGLTREGQLDISDKVSEQLFDEMNKLEMQNAQIAEQALARAFQGTLGMGDLDMRRLQARLSGQLGMGNLKLQELKINIDRAMKELMANLGIQSQYSGSGYSGYGA
jgi:hypothetical protein